MTAAEILNEIHRLPKAEQAKLRETLLKDVTPVDLNEAKVSQDEIDRVLVAEGLLANIPRGADDNYVYHEPVEFTGRPISETIIEERR